MQGDKRDLIFISHATPEDNTFTLWLSTRLKLLGYEVWSDVTELFGGEKWWGDIEQAVDQYTIKFILIITKTSLSKPGVQRELELALAAEEKYQHRNFIIPIIIDDSPFSGQPYGLSDRNIISFNAGWAPGFAKLTERLRRDGVESGSVQSGLGGKLSDLSVQHLQVKAQEDYVLSNWLSIQYIPQYLNFYRLPMQVDQWKKTFDSCPWGWFEWGGMLATFASADDLKPHLPRHFLLSKAPNLDLHAVLKGSPRNHTGFLKSEVIKNVNYLLLNAWGSWARSKGLHKYRLASGKESWFFPGVDEHLGKKPFADIFGEQRKKQVVGYSGKNLVYWHYAVEPKAIYGNHPRFCLIPHVVFTEDGLNPLADKTKMHRLRRGFCRSWWNPRWRDLLLLYAELLSDNQLTMDIPVSPNENIVCDSRPQIFSSRYSLVSDDSNEFVGDVEEIEDVEVVEEALEK